ISVHLAIYLQLASPSIPFFCYLSCFLSALSMASLQADIPTPVKEVVTKETEETTHDDDQESAAVDQDQDLATKDIEFIATAEETDHKPKEVVLPDDIEEDSEVVADDHDEVDKAPVSPIHEEDSKWTEKIEHEAEDQDDEDDEEYW
ncbi:hypothetical protein F2P56_037003, partial [Juglans regia]